MFRGQILRFILSAFAVVSFGCVNPPNYRPRERWRPPTSPASPSAPASQTAQPPMAGAPPAAQGWQPVRAEGAPSAASPIPVNAAQAQGTPAPPGAPPPVAAAAAPTTPASDPANKLTSLYTLAAEKYAGIQTYVARLRCREQINGKDRPEEVMAFKFRTQPFSVYFKFLGPVARGREVVFVQGQYGSNIHTLAAAGDSFFVGAGQRVPPLAPDSLMVKTASRHPITEAGIGNLVERFGRVLTAVERGGGQLGKMTYSGPFKRSEYPTPLEAVVQDIPAKCESSLPRGGRRYWFFEPSLHLPVIVVTLDHTNHEVEYYCYDQIQTGVPLGDNDFNPDKLWGRK